MHCADFPIACQLERIADQLTGFDWNNFASTLLATLVGAGVAAGVSIWLASRERPKPMWRVDVEEGAHSPLDGVTTLKATLTNIGDGTAYHPRALITGDNISGSRRSSEALLEPGTMLYVWFRIPSTGTVKHDVYSGTHVDDRLFDWPKSAALTVEWHQPPRRHRLRRQRLALENPQRTAG